VTLTDALVAPAAIVTTAGTVATLEFSELRLRVRPPAGAGADRVSAMRPCEPAVMASVGGVNRAVAVTWTLTLLVARPCPEAVIVAEPKLVPQTFGCLR